MKRHNNIYAKVCSIENLQHADICAGKGKSKKPGVIHRLDNNCMTADIINQRINSLVNG